MSVQRMVPLDTATTVAATPEQDDYLTRYAVNAIPTDDMREAWWCDKCGDAVDAEDVRALACNSRRRVLIADAPEDAT